MGRKVLSGKLCIGEGASLSFPLPSDKALVGGALLSDCVLRDEVRVNPLLKKEESLGSLSFPRRGLG